MGRLARKKINFDTELNLVPMLDFFLSLIPFLLISTVLATFGGVFVEAPSYKAQSQQQTQPQDKKEEIDLAVQVADGQIKVFGYKSGYEAKIDSITASFGMVELDKFRAYLGSLHEKYSTIKSSLFHASADTRYEDAVSVLNIVRATKVSNNLVLAVGAVK